jgi:hypothetical protein
MEITPLLTSVENRGVRDVLWKKYFSVVWPDGLRPSKKGLYLYMHAKWGFGDMILEKYFWAGQDPRLGTPFLAPQAHAQRSGAPKKLNGSTGNRCRRHFLAWEAQSESLSLFSASTRIVQYGHSRPGFPQTLGCGTDECGDVGKAPHKRELLSGLPAVAI